ncbi:hypothetical protein ACWAUC_19700 [Bradyrhizobium guangdongense]
MWRRQHDLDDFARMERICLDWAGASRFPIERAGLLEMAENYRAAGNKAGRPETPRELSRELTRN